MPISSPADPKTFREQTESRAAFRQRVAASIALRLYPHTALRLKVLAHAVGVSTDTLGNYLSGYSQPDSYVMGRLLAFFDAAFANEVYGQAGLVIAKLTDVKRADELRQSNSLAGLMAEIEKIRA